MGPFPQRLDFHIYLEKSRRYGYIGVVFPCSNVQLDLNGCFSCVLSNLPHFPPLPISLYQVHFIRFFHLPGPLFAYEFASLLCFSLPGKVMYSFQQLYYSSKSFLEAFRIRLRVTHEHTVRTHCENAMRGQG